MDRLQIDPDIGQFEALARSSPWLWRTLHLRHRDSRGEAEAWIRRPGQMVVRGSTGRVDRFDERDPGANRVVLHLGDDLPRERRFVWGHDLDPRWREDELVAWRPEGLDVTYGEPVHGGYRWVAMLDPHELSHDVRLSGLRREVVDGRVRWRSRVAPLFGYEAVCGGCCDLLISDVTMRIAEGLAVGQVREPDPASALPTEYDVALDVRTGVVVHLAPVDGHRDDLWFDTEIIEVDGDVDDVLAGGPLPES